MANPYLPNWEYIPDGEPRVFGDRVYIYGSHDKAGSGEFCDWVLKCWCAPVDNPNEWVCHGDIFRTYKTRDHEADTDWTGPQSRLFAPDVVEVRLTFLLMSNVSFIEVAPFSVISAEKDTLRLLLGTSNSRFVLSELFSYNFTYPPLSPV